MRSLQSAFGFITVEMGVSKKA